MLDNNDKRVPEPMDYANPEALVSVDWLAEHLDDPDLRIVDATYHLPVSERDAAEEYGFRHIPRAVFFDVDTIADQTTDLPHMLPSADRFAEKVGKLGIGNHHKVVIYDGSGGFLAAARAWWMFRLFGHEDVAVLDGGLPHWGKKRKPLSHDEEEIEPTTYEATFNPALVRNIDQIRANIETGDELVVDARNEKRFHGKDWEPRPVKKVGHIPGSINMPFNHLMIARQDFIYRPAGEMAQIFADHGVDFSRPIVASCGSGLTAAVLAFAAHLLGHEEVAVYDGSWAEWGNRDDTPVEL